MLLLRQWHKPDRLTGHLESGSVVACIDLGLAQIQVNKCFLSKSSFPEFYGPPRALLPALFYVVLCRMKTSELLWSVPSLVFPVPCAPGCSPSCRLPVSLSKLFRSRVPCTPRPSVEPFWMAPGGVGVTLSTTLVPLSCGISYSRYLDPSAERNVLQIQALESTHTTNN